MKNKKNSKKDQKKIIDLIVKILLIIIIIILFLHNCSLMKNRNLGPVSTGNVQIIEIKCDATNTCNNPNGNGETNNQGQNEKPGNSGSFVVYDGEIKWDGITEAKIFKNPMYRIEGTIAPEDSNTYQFVVKNSTNYKLNYSLNFIEDNPYNANIKYKLKKNKNYIIDHYVSASELATKITNLPANGSDTLYLEWKWISADNDTQIGSLMNGTYGLKIEIKAESVNG